MLKFLYSKVFLINLGIAIVLVCLFIWGIFSYIDSYTKHGETISVPSLEGLSMKEVDKILTEKNLRYTVLDSVYIEDAEKGVVLEQDPFKDDLVKENRTIYVTVSKVIPPNIEMPNVVDMSQRLAIAKLESYGFKVETKYIPSKDVNAVLMQEINGKEVKPKSPVKLGSTVMITIGAGSGGAKVLVPYLINLTKEEAKAELMASSLSIGFADYSDCKCETAEDTLNAKIYRQSPIRSTKVAVEMGSIVDVYLTCDTSRINFNPPAIDSTATDTMN